MAWKQKAVSAGPFTTNNAINFKKPWLLHTLQNSNDIRFFASSTGPCTVHVFPGCHFRYITWATPPTMPSTFESQLCLGCMTWAMPPTEKPWLCLRYITWAMRAEGQFGRRSSLTAPPTSSCSPCLPLSPTLMTWAPGSARCAFGQRRNSNNNCQEREKAAEDRL